MLLVARVLLLAAPVVIQAVPPAGCPGGSLSSCVASCPGAPLPAYQACVQSCTARCTAPPAPPYVVPKACQPAACCPPDLPMGGGRGGNAQIRGPAAVDPGGIADWMAKMMAMRTACQQAIGYNGSAFEVPELKWTQTAYISPQMHPYDRYFFDPSLGNGTNGSGYTVDKWLGDLNRRYGGIDKTLIWPTYTQIGIDDRNTWDLIRSLPGGAEGVKVVVEQLHDRGVKVLWPYHPWDHSTRGQEKNNVTDFVAMAEVNRDTGADGFNADTMTHVPQEFYDEGVRLYKPLAIEAEGGITSTWDLNYVTLGWAEGWNAWEPYAVNNIPNVDKAKWLSDGKAMHNWCDRWSGDQSEDEVGAKSINKTAELQVSFFNGLGYETWENVWGVWNGIIPRDGENIRRVATLLRYFGRRGFLQSPDWRPHTSAGLQMNRGVFVSAFPKGNDEIVYFSVNMKETAVRGAQLFVGKDSKSWYDCWSGKEILKGTCPTTNCHMPVLTENGTGYYVHLEIDPNGFGCVVGTNNHTKALEEEGGPTEEELRGESPPVPVDLTALLKTMGTLTKQPIESFSASFQFLQQTMVVGNKTQLRTAGSAAANETYVHGGDFHFVASGVELEGGPDSGVDVQYSWEDHPVRHHKKDMYIGAMIVDTFPVTNSQYEQYLQASGDRPSDTANWLKQNFENGKPTPGWEDKPVTYVSLDDARLYCAYHNKRLPHAYEWQYFAQGTDGRLYPWGNADDPSLTPALSNNFTNPGPEPVGKYPGGASPFKIQDLVRSVWQYTSEFQDIHTRAVILRGGSNWNAFRGKECRWIDGNDGTPPKAPGCANASLPGMAELIHSNANVPGSYDLTSGKNLSHVMGGSHWYFPPAYQLNSYNKYYLMSGAYERAGTVGFRCVADAEDDCGTDGRVCGREASPPATKTFHSAPSPTAVFSDWAVFGAAEHGKTGGALSNISKAGVPSAQQIGPLVSLGSQPAHVIQRGATAFSWSGGSGTPADGLSSGAVVFGGVDGGFALSSPAATAGKAATLTLFVGGELHAHGLLQAHVQGEMTAMEVTSASSVVSLTYKGGPLSLTYKAANGSVCANERLCVLPITSTWPIVPQNPTGNRPITLSGCTPTLKKLSGCTPSPATGGRILDWVRWSHVLAHVDTLAPWPGDRMKNGLQPSMWNPTNSSPLVNYTTPIQYAFSGGSPTDHALHSNAGVATNGSISMQIPAHQGRWQLTLYCGVLNATARLTVTASGQPSVTRLVDTLTQHVDTSGDDSQENGLAMNLKVIILFEGPITVEWALVKGSSNEKSLVSWQAAVLEEPLGAAAGRGGVTLQAVALEI